MEIYMFIVGACLAALLLMFGVLWEKGAARNRKIQAEQKEREEKDLMFRVASFVDDSIQRTIEGRVHIAMDKIAKEKK